MDYLRFSLLASLCFFVELKAQVLTDSIGEIVVVGQANEKINSASPQFGISSKDIQKLGIFDIGDALHHLPGIALRDYGGAGGMKTVAVRGFGAQHTGVSYDGIMLSDCQTGQIDLQRYSLENLQNIRLQVGDDDNIFMPARNISSAATIMIETANDRLLDAGCTIGSWGFVNPMLSFGDYISNKVYIGGNADFIHADNNYPFTLINVTNVTRENRTNSQMNQGHAELNVKVDGRHSMLMGKVYYYDNNRELPGVVHYYTNLNDETLHERNLFTQLQYKNAFSDKFSLLLNGKWNWASSNYHNGMPNGGIQSAEYFQREYYASAAFLYVPTQRMAFDYSIDYFVNNINSQLFHANSPSRKSLLQSLSAKYTQNRLTLICRLLWSNYLSESNQLSPSASISFKLMEEQDLYIRVSYKNIFRMPSFNELYYFHYGQNDLRPEKTNQFNLGLTYKHGNGSRVKGNYTIDAYFNKITDKIVSIPVNMFIWRNINMAKADAYGLDFTAEVSYLFSPEHSVSVNTNYSLQRVANTTNEESRSYKNQIAYTPLHSGSATLSWQNPWVNLSFTGEGMDDRWVTNEHAPGTRLAGFMEFACSAYRQFSVGKSHFVARASMLNIFDKQYDIVTHYPMPGRSWKISLTFKY